MTSPWQPQITAFEGAFQTMLRYVWDNELPPTSGGALWVLGRSYDSDNEAWPPEFVADVTSRTWLMYRTGISPIARDPEGPSPLQIGALLRGVAIDPSSFLSDVGWGCMIRTGQSLLANALARLLLGRDWRFDGTVSAEEKQLLELFYDEPDAPLSLHRFVAHGSAHCGKLPGQWFGPSAVASCIRALIKTLPNDLRLAVYVSDGMDVYEDALTAVAEAGGSWRPTLVLCGLRLGLNNVNPVYYDGIRALFTAPQAVGMAGGRPSASHYFYGFQDTNLFYHDPHQPKPALRRGSTDDLLASVHSSRMRALDMAEMDPSLLVGFLLETPADFAAWKTHMMQVPQMSRAISVNAFRPPLSVASDCESDSDSAEDGDDEAFIVCENTRDSLGLEKSAGPTVDQAVSNGDPEVVVTTPNVADESSIVIDSESFPSQSLFSSPAETSPGLRSSPPHHSPDSEPPRVSSSPPRVSSSPPRVSSSPPR